MQRGESWEETVVIYGWVEMAASVWLVRGMTGQREPHLKLD